MRHAIKAFSLSLMLLIVAVGAGSENTSSAAVGADRPNIIVILTDDLDAQSIAFMPQLKALLSDQGVSFSNFFVSFSLCCPSRATVLRGQYAHNTQILGNRPPDGGFEKFHTLGEENSTIATWLQAARRCTSAFGIVRSVRVRYTLSQGEHRFRRSRDATMDEHSHRAMAHERGVDLWLSAGYL